MRKTVAISLLFILLLSGCRSTKYVPEGEYLLNKVSVQSDNKEVKPSDVNPFIKQKANVRILGKVKFDLWLYNRSPKNGDGWLTRFLRNIGEPPVVYDEDRTIQSQREIKRYLFNKGFTEAVVEKDSVYDERRRKVEITYQLTCNEPYRIAQADINIPDTAIRKIVMKNSSKSLLSPGNRFDLDVLDAERERISATLKNEGYYDFNKNNFHYQVDTALGNYKVNDVLILKEDTANPERSYIPKHIKDVYFVVGYDAKEALKNPNYFDDMDTVVAKGMYFLSSGEAAVEPDILLRNNLLQPGMLYSKLKSDNTHALLSAINIVRFVNIKYEELPGDMLSCEIFISLSELQSYSLVAEGTNISGNFGWGANLGYVHKNLFKGAEQLSANVNLGQEAIIGIQDGNVDLSLEIGADVKLSYPKFVFPFLDEDFIQKSRAKTDFGTSFNYQRRPEYIRNIATANMVYNWSKTDVRRHQLTPLMLNYISIPSMTDEFRAHIDTTEYLKYSYDDHVIFGTRYAITFQGGKEGVENVSRYLRLQIESSGNMANLVSKMSGKDKIQVEDDDGNVVDEYYDMFGVRFSQYLKFDANAVVSHYMNESNTMVYRTQIGLGLPYQNSSQLPFEKRYFGGGANGVRAWMVRSLGPGTYYNEKVDYMNQSGDINLVASAEYRFKLFQKLDGAMFADAGNTWALHDFEGQSGAAFSFDTFYQQIAVGVGAGLRLDLSFFVFRLDAAVKAIDPREPLGDRWVLGQEWKPTTHIAIGYPF